MKYEPLTAYLRESGEERIQLTFAHLDDILSFRLGKSPRNHRAWWANGGHDHASAWMDAGYKVEAVNLTQETVVFVKDGAANTPDKTAAPKAEKIAKLVMQEIPRRTTDDIITLCGYKFSFVQELIPECDGDGRIKEYQPQTDYQKQKPLNAHGSGSFCRFTIHAGNWPGVYLWVADDEIIYIGETAGLARRFNTGYGVIEPVNCYVGGQSTNCKMNKVVLEQAKAGKYVKLYFRETEDYKAVEHKLLGQYKTKYNVKDNQ